MLDFIAWVLMGGLIGWVASWALRAWLGRAVALNIMTGVIGAFLAGVILTPLLGMPIPAEGHLSLPALVMSLIGAVTLLAVMIMFRGRPTH